MALNNRYLRFGVTNEEVEKTTVMLRSDSQNNASSLQINIENGRELHSDLIYVQVSGNISNVIFHSFLRPSECRVFTCPHDVMRNSLATVTVYSVKTFRDKRCVWHRIVMGGRTSAILKGGFTINYLKVKLQPYRTYLDLLTDAPNKIPYHIDVVSTIPQRYMLTDEDYRGDTDGLILLLHQIHPPDAFLVMFRRRPEKTYRIPFVLNPAAEYKQQLFRVYTRHDTEDVCTGDSHSTVTTFTTYMTQCEVLELHTKATNFVSSRQPCFSNISHFYRNKSFVYFNNIINSGGIMYKYGKNWGGDQASTLNRQIEGLFFSTNVDPDTLLPPRLSYFGPVRLHVPTYALLNDATNMYFSDFYCHRVNHKVQIVLAVKDSQADRFCRKQLVLIDERNNPFLVRVGYGPNEIVKVTANVTVELFYTEDVPITALMCNHKAYFTETKQKGNALAMVNGIPKNKDCRICNLDSFLRAHQLL